ncbi:hypothetical protein C0993_008519 [Termitomyces sp. T159_Od127]|nr:hypothetical protein C0993_008519 [Termitomyces sp. T159_Od127]
MSSAESEDDTTAATRPKTKRAKDADPDFIDSATERKLAKRNGKRVDRPNIAEVITDEEMVSSENENEATALERKLDPMARQDVAATQSLIKEVEQLSLGYVLIHPATDDEFGEGPLMRRRVYNKREALPSNLDMLYRSTNRGRNLDTMNPANCIKIGAGADVFKVAPSTDVASAPVIKYNEQFHGLIYSNLRQTASEESLSWFPVLLDGGHRMDLVQKRIYGDAIDMYTSATERLKTDVQGDLETWQTQRDTARKVLSKTVWLAQVYDMPRLLRHKRSQDIINHLTSNKPLYQVKENDENLVLMACDTILNATEEPIDALAFYLSECLDITSTMNTRIKAGLCNPRATSALAELMRFPWYRTHGIKAFTSNVLSTWSRVALPLVVPYIEWAGLALKVLSSTHKYAISIPYPEECAITSDVTRSINDDLEQFNELSAPEQELYPDFLDDEFFDMLARLYGQHLAAHFYLFGTNLDLQPIEIRENYEGAWKKYIADLRENCVTWIRSRQLELTAEEDRPLLTLLDRLPDRLRWLIEAQVAASYHHPKLATPTPLIVPDFICRVAKNLALHEEGLIQILSQFEPLAHYVLRTAQGHSVTKRTYTKLIEELMFKRYKNKVPSESNIRRAICAFVGVVLVHRNVGLESMRSVNGVHLKTNRELPPEYHAEIFDTKNEALTGAVNALISICRMAQQRGVKRIDETTWFALNSTDIAPTSQNLITLILNHTAVPWDLHALAQPGSANGNNYYRMLCIYIYFVARVVYTKSAGPKYNIIGHEYGLFRRPEVHAIVDDILQIPWDPDRDFAPAFQTWHTLGDADMEGVNVAHENATQQYAVFRQTLVQDANAMVNDVFKKMMRSNLFSLSITGANSRKVRVLKRESRSLLERLIEVTRNELVNVSRYEYATEDVPYPELSEQDVRLITSRLHLPALAQLPEATRAEEKAFHGRTNMIKLAESAALGPAPNRGKRQKEGKSSETAESKGKSAKTTSKRKRQANGPTPQPENQGQL